MVSPLLVLCGLLPRFYIISLSNGSSFQLGVPLSWLIVAKAQQIIYFDFLILKKLDNVHLLITLNRSN